VAGDQREEPDAPAAPASATSPLAAPSPSFGRALRSRPFLLLWVSQLVSQSGDFIFDVALIWLVLETTGSIFAVGVVVTAALIPTVAVGPILGVYVDRWSRRTILLVTNVVEGLRVAVLAGLVLGHDVNLAVIVAIVLALGVGSQAVRLASNAMVPQTVGKEDLGPANGLVQISSSSTQVVGLSIGGIVVAVLGVSLPITYDAITFIAAAVIVAFIARSVGAPEPPEDGKRASFSHEFLEGIRFLRTQRYLLELISIGVVLNFCGNAIFTLWAPYAEFVLHGGAATYGFLGAALAIGSILGAVVVGKIDVRRHVGRLAFVGVAVGGGVVVLLGLTHSIPLALAESFSFGVMVSVINVPLFAAIQAKVPARLMGRMMAAFLSCILAAAPIGAFFAGTMAEATSIGFVYVVLGAALVGMSAVGALFLGDVRRLAY
jgi:MFS transporter, DHA3 family, macrolide efflux protein